jgi:nitrate/nitrite transporter NarK
MRPVGGWLADRIGGAQVLSWVFGGVAMFSLLLTWPSMVPFVANSDRRISKAERCSLTVLANSPVPVSEMVTSY